MQALIIFYGIGAKQNKFNLKKKKKKKTKQTKPHPKQSLRR
jgi:hypothetical protein